jgi:hypothetical protein
VNISRLLLEIPHLNKCISVKTWSACQVPHTLLLHPICRVDYKPGNDRTQISTGTWHPLVGGGKNSKQTSDSERMEGYTCWSLWHLVMLLSPVIATATLALRCSALLDLLVPVANNGDSALTVSLIWNTKNQVRKIKFTHAWWNTKKNQIMLLLHVGFSVYTGQGQGRQIEFE